MKNPRSAVVKTSYTIATAAFVLFQVALWRTAKVSQNGSIPQAATVLRSPRHLRESSSTSDKPKTLVGIFSTLEDTSKTWHRQIFARYPDRVCTLGDFQTKLSDKERKACQVIYTFVIGANPYGPTEIITSGNGAPKLLVKRSERNFASDIQSEDCTLLNIKYVLHTTDTTDPLTACAKLF
eukprot:scaffold543_cov119-Cylindrotheca_fusiformis.AAC.21